MNFLNASVNFWILALSALLALWLVSWYANRRRLFVCRQLTGPDRMSEALVEVSFAKRRFRSILFVGGVVLALVALARPWWGKRLIPYPSRSRDVLIVFDCSRSMLADDVAPSRLDHGKWLVRKLMSHFPEDRFGLVAFAGSAFLECPLTQDRGSFNLILDELDSRTIPLGGTNIDSALKAADKAFQGAEGTDRAVVLVTDGDELQGDSLAYAGTLRKKNIPLFVIGLGNPSQGTLIRDKAGQFVRDKDNKLVTTKLAENRLKQLGKETAGIYVRSTTVAPNLAPVIDKIDSLVPADREEKVKKREIERYQIPLAMSVGCFLLFLCVGEKKKRVAHILVMTFVAASLQARGEAPAPAPAHDPAAVAELKKAVEQAEGEDKARLYQNLGVRYQKAGDLKKAEEAYNQAVFYGKEGGDAATAAQWNLGVIQHRIARSVMAQKPSESLADLQAAEDHYRKALRWTKNPSDLGKNQELLLEDRKKAEQLKKEQEKQKKQQQDKAGGNQQKNPKNTDNQNQKNAADQKNGKPTDKNQQNKSEPGDKQIQGSQEKGAEQQEMGKPTPKGTLDKKQAAAVLADMRAREKDLREALKEQQMRNMKTRQVEKNW